MRPILSSLLVLVCAYEQADKFNLPDKDVPEIMKYAKEIFIIGTIIDENFKQKLSQFLPEECVACLERADTLLSQVFGILSNKDLKLLITEEKLNLSIYVIFLLLLVSNRFNELLDPIDRYPEKLQPSIKKLKEFLDRQVEEEGEEFRATTEETLDEFEKILAEIKDHC